MLAAKLCEAMAHVGQTSSTFGRMSVPGASDGELLGSFRTIPEPGSPAATLLDVWRAVVLLALEGRRHHEHSDSVKVKRLRCESTCLAETTLGASTRRGRCDPPPFLKECSSTTCRQAVLFFSSFAQTVLVARPVVLTPSLVGALGARSACVGRCKQDFALGKLRISSAARGGSAKFHIASATLPPMSRLQGVHVLGASAHVQLQSMLQAAASL